MMVRLRRSLVPMQMAEPFPYQSPVVLSQQASRPPDKQVADKQAPMEVAVRPCEA